MAGEAFYLTAQDVAVIREFLGQWGKRKRNNGPRETIQLDDGFAPEVYLAYIPAGIPHRTGTTVNSAPGTVYRILKDELVITSIDKTIYNPSLTVDIPVDSWAVVLRDKFGTWMAQAALGDGGDGGDGTGTCGDCGWLIDPGLAHAFRIRIYAGSETGRCRCISAQGMDDDDPFLLLPVVGTGEKRGNKLLATCCGCGAMSVSIGLPTTGGGDIDDAAILEADVNVACDDGLSFSYRLPLECCSTGPEGQRRATFSAGREKLCNGEVTDCYNNFRVEIECAPCDKKPVDCPVCVEGGVAPKYLLVSGTFIDPLEEYNGEWPLEYVGVISGVCTWQGSCGDVTVKQEVWFDAEDNVAAWRTTYSGVETIVFESNGFGLPSCWGGPTTAYVSGGTSGYPGTITSTWLGCSKACETQFGNISSAVVYLSHSHCVVSGPVSSYSVISNLSGVSWTAGGGDGSGTDTDKGFGVVVVCNLDGTVDIGPFCSEGGLCYSGPPNWIRNVPNEATAPDVLFTVTYTIDDPDCSDNGAEVTVTITNLGPP